MLAGTSAVDAEVGLTLETRGLLHIIAGRSLTEEKPALASFLGGWEVKSGLVRKMCDRIIKIVVPSTATPRTSHTNC